jgi:dihydroorotate dehydrogenase electron transfer subunit
VSPDRVQAPFGRRAATISGRRELGPYVVLSCEDPDGPRPQAGQFYMLSAAERWGGGQDGRPFLPRAISVMRAGMSHPARGSRDRPSRAPETGPIASAVTTGRHPAGPLALEFMLADVGPGTHRLCELDVGDELLLVGPLGIGFTAPREGRRAVLVGGGVGIAPLVILADQLHERSPDAGLAALLGFRDAEHAAGAVVLAGAKLATDDGSAGHPGPVTELLADELHLQPHSEVYACGPPAMLEAVRLLCAERELPAQLALESGMACGFGACFGCVVHTREGYVRLCVEGPVLDAGRLQSVLAGGVTG